MAIQVSCINKTPRNDPHLRIQNIGGINPDGTQWKLSEDEAIAGIESGEWSFYVNVGGQRVDVTIATHEGHKYLKTTADGLHPNNLLALDECPS
jgi:Protein of unknown function (DUF3892)